MKRLVSKLKSLPLMRNAALLSGVFMFQTASQAQVLVGCINSDNTYSSLTTQPYMLNADMVEMAGNQLQVVAWDSYGLSPTVTLKVIDEATGFSATQSIPAKAEAQPDVVWATDPNDPSIFIVAVVFLDASGFVNFNTYKVTNAGTSSMAIGLRSSRVLTSTRGFFPHIDMLPDFDQPINGYPSLHRFAITYSTMTAPATYDLRELHGDITAPTVFSSLTYISTAGNYLAGGDIGVSYDPVTKKEHMYIAYSNGLNIKMTELITNYPSGPTAPATIVSTTNIMSSSTNFIPYPRIDAMGYNAISSGLIVPWVIVAPINGTIWSYDIYGATNASVSLSSTDYNQIPAVTAGPGRVTGNVCNDNYNIGWHNSSYGYMTRVIDAYTGYISTTYPDYYQANYTTVVLPGGASKIPIALASCSNSGNYLFTGFWDGGSNVLYHSKAGIAGYKPGHTTGIGNITNNNLKVYPNPASDKINIKGLKTGTYNVINVVGQTLKSGIINNENVAVDIASLPNGNYILAIKSIEGNQNVSFVKQ